MTRCVLVLLLLVCIFRIQGINSLPIRSKMDYRITQGDSLYQHVCNLEWKIKFIENLKFIEYDGGKILQLICKISYLEYKIKKKLEDIAEQHPTLLKNMNIKPPVQRIPIKMWKNKGSFLETPLGPISNMDSHIKIFPQADNSKTIRRPIPVKQEHQSEEVRYKLQPVMKKNNTRQQRILYNLLNSDKLATQKDTKNVQREHLKPLNLNPAMVKLLKTGFEAHIAAIDRSNRRPKILSS